MQGKPCQAWHALDNVMSHIQSLLWQKMQPTALSIRTMRYRAPEGRAQAPARADWAWEREGRTEGGNNISLFQQQHVVNFSLEHNTEPCQNLQGQGHPKPM